MFSAAKPCFAKENICSSDFYSGIVQPKVKKLFWFSWIGVICCSWDFGVSF